MKKRFSRNHHTISYLVPIFVFFSFSPGWSQSGTKEKKSQATDSKHPGDVYINDSFEAADALTKARALADQKRWREAAELLQQTSDSLGDRVLDTAKGFVGLRMHVAERICAWPPEGLRAYQELYDAKLQRELESLGDPVDLDVAVRLFDRYFCTSGAAAMGDRIAELAIESGDLPLARWALQRVLENHPAKRPFVERYQSLLVLLSAMTGQSNGSSLPPGTTRLRWKGRDTTLESALRDIAQEFQPAEATRNTDWPVLGGNPQRNRITKTNVGEPGLLWRAPLHVQEPTNKDPFSSVLIHGATEKSRQAFTVPVAVGDLVYVQTNRDVMALRRSSGTLAWALRSSDEKSPESAYLDDKPVGGDSPSVDEGRLFAALPSDDNTFYDYDTSRSVPELVALNAQTGDVLWRVAQKSADAQGTITTFDSAPAPRNGRVYVASRRKRSFGFEDCYLDAYRATDGKILFHTHLASASTAILGARGVTRSIIAIEGDSVFVGTNLGAVACVNAYTGGVHWLRLYDRMRSDAPGGTVWAVRDAGAAGLNPAISNSHRVVVLATDSARLMVLDESDGKLLFDIPVARVSNVHTLYGVEGDLVCGVGDTVFCYDFRRDTMIWSASGSDNSTITGRGAWSGDQLLVPRQDGLLRISASSGQAESIAMGPHFNGGNILALPDEIFVAGTRELLCYVRKAEIWKTVQARMDASPGDPLPALEFAEVALGAGEIDDAVKAMDEAIARIKPSLSSAPVPVRNRVFSDVLKILDALSAPAKTAERMFQYASESAASMESQVEYRFRFGQFFEAAGDPKRAVRLYQQILRDRTLRDWPPARVDANAVRAHVRATTKINELIQRFGVEVYAEMEAQARQKLEAAKATADREGLEEIANAYPHSRASLDALKEQARLLEQSREFAVGAAVWQRAYQLEDQADERQQIIRHIAESYEKANRPELAYLWLVKAARAFPEAVFERAGKVTTFAEFRDQLSHAKSRVEPSRPTVSLPLAAAFQQDLIRTPRLLSPMFPEIPGTNWDAAYFHNPDGIRAYAADRIWEKPFPVRMHAELITARSDYALFATPFEVFALDAKSGEPRYSRGEYPARLQDPGADWEDGRSFRTHAVHGDRLVSVHEDGLAECIDISTGNLVWTARRQPAPLGVMTLSESMLAYHISREGHAVLQLVSAASGDLLDSIVTEETRPIQDLRIMPDGGIILVTSKSIACYDPAMQTRRWHAALNWPIRQATLQYDMDSVYFIDDSGVLRRITAETGQPAWESQRLIGRGEDHPRLGREGEYLFVMTSSSVSAVDVADGQLLWQGTTPENPHFVQWAITNSYLAALQAPEGAVDGIGQVYFYDHRNASGVIPKSGGVLDLGVVTDIRGMIAINGGLVIQTGSTIRGFAQGK